MNSLLYKAFRRMRWSITRFLSRGSWRAAVQGPWGNLASNPEGDSGRPVVSVGDEGEKDPCDTPERPSDLASLGLEEHMRAATLPDMPARGIVAATHAEGLAGAGANEVYGLPSTSRPSTVGRRSARSTGAPCSAFEKARERRQELP